MRQGDCVTAVTAESAVYACIGGRFGERALPVLAPSNDGNCSCYFLGSTKNPEEPQSKQRCEYSGRQNSGAGIKNGLRIDLQQPEVHFGESCCDLIQPAILMAGACVLTFEFWLLNLAS
jgi:hypothetical protein